MKTFERIVSNEVPGYKIWPHPKRDILFPIIYLEPGDWRNLRAMGYDMYSDDIRQDAMGEAIRLNRPIISAPVELVQETKEDPQLGFLIYVPVYETGEEILSEESRARHVFGLIYSPFRTKDLFGQIMKNLEELPVWVSVHYQGRALYEERGSEVLPTLSSEIEVAGKQWVVSTSPRDGLFPQSESLIPLLIFVFGTSLSIVVASFLIRLRRQTQELAEQSQSLQQIQDASRVLTSKLELKDVLQSLTDIGLELSRAEFGAFFYNMVDEAGESYMLYTLSGVDREEFEKFPMPRNTDVFSVTFKGETLLSSDITKDPRFGKNAPHNGLPKGHLPVKSYLAVAVKSKEGEVIGALFYGHSTEGCFTDREKGLIESLSQQAAVAIENATLFQNSQRAIATREEFLNIASHELKTPITSLLIQFQSAMRMIRQKNPAVYEPEAVEKRITRALRQLDKMQKLIDEMLDSSRIALGKFEIKKAHFDLLKMTKDLLERYEEQFRAQEINVSMEIDPSASLDFEGDEYHIEQVFSNLLNNAIKYGEGRPIQVRFNWDAETICFSVKDQGSGVPEENLPKIFERYERLVSATNVSGLGLGLYISKSIVDAHDGDIEVESVLGEGSIFTVRLPRS